jgi:hypothetical protein
MAGVLLYLSKHKNNTERFNSKIAQLEKFIKEYLFKYFDKIEYRRINHFTYIIEFRIDHQLKFYSDEQGNWLSYEGTVFSLDQTKLYTAEELWKLYLQKGMDFANQLDGHFVIKLYDRLKDTILVISDIIKNKTNFFAENNEFLLFTPFLACSAIIRKPEIDTEAFNEFMWRYYILSNRSMLKGIHRLDPAVIYSIDRAGFKIKKHTYWQWPDRYSDLSFHDTVDKTVQSMQETARLIHKAFNKPAIDLTMGQDSRQVVCAFLNQNLPFASVTFGKPGFYEVKKVQDMARRHNFENYNAQLSKSFFTDIYEHFTKAIILGNVDQPGHQLARILHMRDQYSGWGNVSLNGVDGHFYKNGLWDEQYTFNLYREPKAFNIGLFLKLRALSSNYYDDIFDDALLKIKEHSKEYFYQLIQNCISSYHNSPVSIQVDKFDLSHWLNFIIVANNSSNCIIPHISPLLLRRNLEFALQVPVKWKFNLSKYQRAVVFKLSPELAAEKTDFGGVNMIPKNFFTYIPFFFKYYNFQTRRMRNKIKAKIGFKVITHLQEAWDYLPLYQHLYTTPEIKDLLEFKNMNLSSIIREDPWNEFKNSQVTGLKIKDLEFMLKIAGIEQFLSLIKKVYVNR